MAATLASLWEKKKQVKPDHATNHVALTVTEDPASNSGATATNFQTHVHDGLSHHSHLYAPDSSIMQSQGPDKKRKRAQPSSQQLQILQKVLSSSHQPSTEEISSAAKKAAVPEQVVKHWLEEQQETQAKKASVLPQNAKVAVPMQHDPDGSTPAICRQASHSLGAHDDVLAATNLTQAYVRCRDVAVHEHPGKAQQAREDVAAAQLAQSHNTASPKATQSTSKQHLLEQHGAELKQCMQQARAMKPLADLPLFTDGQLNRPEVWTVLQYQAIPNLLRLLFLHNMP